MVPIATRAVRDLAVHAWRRAEAMGLVEPDLGSLDASGLGRLLRRIRDAGIAREPALRFDNVEPLSVEETEALLRFVLAALESSPVPKFEWPAVSRTLEADQLAGLLNISVSSLRRYLSSERQTPDDVAARLHHVALIVGDLLGAYNDVGVRRWFDRPRSALGGRRPAAVLSGNWNPDDPSPRRVRDLAQSLVTLAAT
jgi:uncharacterized protein (DUF2384 family)